jgi:hypothetical protein
LAAIAQQRKKEMNQQQPSIPGSTLETIGAGSSSALLTTSSMAHSIRSVADCTHALFDGNEHGLELPSIMQELDESTTHSKKHDPDAFWEAADLVALENALVETGQYNDDRKESMSSGECNKSEQDGPIHDSEAVDVLFDDLTRPKSRKMRLKQQRSNSSHSNLLSMRSGQNELRAAGGRERAQRFHTSVNYDSQGHVMFAPQQIQIHLEVQRRIQNDSLHSAEKRQHQAEPYPEHEQSGRAWRNLGASFIRRMRNVSSSNSYSANQRPTCTTEPGPFDPSSLSSPLTSGCESLRIVRSGNTSVHSSYQTAQSGYSAEEIASPADISLHSSFQTTQPGYTSGEIASPADEPSSPPRKVNFAVANNKMRVSFAEESGDSDDEFYDESDDGEEYQPPSKRRYSWAMPRRRRVRERNGAKLSHSATLHQRVLGEGITDADRVKSILRNSTNSSTGDVGTISKKPHLGSEPSPLTTQDASHSHTSGAHTEMQLLSDEVSRNELIKKSKAWKSTKKGAAKLVKGTVKTVKTVQGTVQRVKLKSIRNFASDFKNALATGDSFDDWAVLDGEDMVQSDSSIDVGDDMNNSGYRMDPDSEIATGSGRSLRRFHSNGEEEKAEIDVNPEEPTESSRRADEYEKHASSGTLSASR